MYKRYILLVSVLTYSPVRANDAHWWTGAFTGVGTVGLIYSLYAFSNTNEPIEVKPGMDKQAFKEFIQFVHNDLDNRSKNTSHVDPFEINPEFYRYAEILKKLTSFKSMHMHEDDLVAQATSLVQSIEGYFIQKYRSHFFSNYLDKNELDEGATAAASLGQTQEETVQAIEKDALTNPTFAYTCNCQTVSTPNGSASITIRYVHPSEVKCEKCLHALLVNRLRFLLYAKEILLAPAYAELLKKIEVTLRQLKKDLLIAAHGDVDALIKSKLYEFGKDRKLKKLLWQTAQISTVTAILFGCFYIVSLDHQRYRYRY